MTHKLVKPAHPAPTPHPHGINDYKVPYKFVEVIWDDATANDASWTAIKDLSEPAQVISRGWLVKEDNKYVCLAASLSNEELEEDSVGNTMTIPRGMIARMREIGVREIKPKQPKAPVDDARTN